MKSLRAGCLALVLLTFCVGVADAQFFLVAETGGLRFLSGNRGDLLETGLVFGGAVGYEITPILALVGRGDVGFHGGESEYVDNGVSAMGTIGLRLLPAGGRPESTVRPYVGAGIGRAALAFTWNGDVFGDETDAIGSWVFSGDAGVDFMISENLGIGGGGRLNLHVYDDETIEGLDLSDFDGNDVTAFAALLIRL